IAINLYTPQDEALIRSKRSALHGGVTRESIPDLPKDLEIAEDIFDCLIKKEDECEQQCGCMQEGADLSESEDVKKPTPATIKKIVDKIKKLFEKKCKQDILIKKNNESFENIKKRKPTLCSEIDKSLRMRFISQAFVNFTKKVGFLFLI